MDLYRELSITSLLGYEGQYQYIQAILVCVCVCVREREREGGREEGERERETRNWYLISNNMLLYGTL